MNIALIPAKGTSRRIPKKNVMDFCGKPLVEWTIEQADNSKLFDKVVFSTDNILLTDMANIKGQWVMPDTIVRPPELCQDDTTQEQVIRHTIDTLGLKDEDYIILMQPTSPLRTQKNIYDIIRSSCNGWAAMTVVYEPDLFLWDVEGNPITINKKERKLNAHHYRETGSMYSVNVEAFNRSNSRYGDWIIQYTNCEKWQQFELDEQEDIEIVEYLFRRHILNET